MVRKMAEGKSVVTDEMQALFDNEIRSSGSVGRVRLRGSSYCNDESKVSWEGF